MLKKKKKLFSAVPNRFKYRRNAWFRDIVFKRKILCSSKSFQKMSECILRDIIFKKISVVLNRFKYVRMHALETLFSFVSLKLQVVSNTIRIVQTSKTIERKKVGCYTKTRVNHIWVDLWRLYKYFVCRFCFIGHVFLVYFRMHCTMGYLLKNIAVCIGTKFRCYGERQNDSRRPVNSR